MSQISKTSRCPVKQNRNLIRKTEIDNLKQDGETSERSGACFTECAGNSAGDEMRNGVGMLLLLIQRLFITLVVLMSLSLRMRWLL